MIEINKARPQRDFEGMWAEAFSVLSLAWKTTLAYHTAQSEERKDKLFCCLKEISQEMQQTTEKLYSQRREIVNCLYEKDLKLHNNEWYPFINDLESLVNNFNMAILRLFLFNDVLLQTDRKYPKRDNIEEVFNNNLKKLAQIKTLVDEMLSENGALATHEAIVITRSIGQGLSFEQAEKLERERWS